jgi:hypothetical protein
MTKVLGKIRTADGFVFYHLFNGQVVDNLNASAVDMSWDTLQQFVDSYDDADRLVSPLDGTLLEAFTYTQETG